MMSFLELYTNLVVSPLYIIVLVMSIGYLIFNRKGKGFFSTVYKIYSLFIVVNYFIALFFRFFH
jgi:hypothetical protein